MKNEQPPEGFKFSKLMDPNENEKEMKPSIKNINIRIMRTDIETMVQKVRNGYKEIEIDKQVAEYYDLLLRTYELELKYNQSPKETQAIDFFEDGG